MITWKWLQRVSDFSIFGDNELVCPMGFSNRCSLRRETQLKKKKKRQIAISIPLIFISRAVKSAENLFFLNQVFYCHLNMNTHIFEGLLGFYFHFVFLTGFEIGLDSSGKKHFCLFLSVLMKQSRVTLCFRSLYKMCFIYNNRLTFFHFMF